MRAGGFKVTKVNFEIWVEVCEFKSQGFSKPDQGAQALLPRWDLICPAVQAKFRKM
jgi:hypothetical protein